MRFIRLGEYHADRPDVLAAPVAARWLHVASLMWARRQPDPGSVLTTAQARALARAQGVQAGMIAALVREKLWSEVDGGYLIKDLGAHLGPVSTERVREWRRRQAVAPRAPVAGGADRKEGREAVPQPFRNRSARGPRKHAVAGECSPDTAAPQPQADPARPRLVAVGEIVGAPDYVATFVDASTALGVSPIPATKARVGKAAKELASAGKSPELIVTAIERLVATNKAPTALPYLVADLEREEAGHSGGGAGRLSPKAERTEEFIRRALARRQEAAS